MCHMLPYKFPQFFVSTSNLVDPNTILVLIQYIVSVGAVR